MATHIVVISFFLLVVAGSFTDLLRDSASSLQEAEKTAFTWTNCGSFYHQNSFIFLFNAYFYLPLFSLSLHQMKGSNEDTTKIVSLEVSPDPIVQASSFVLPCVSKCVILFFFSTQMFC